MVDSWLHSLAMDCPLLNDGFHQNRNRFRQSDRHAAGSDSIFAALSSGLCQRAFVSAARIDGLAKRPPEMAALRARRERNSRAFIVDKGTPNLCAGIVLRSFATAEACAGVYSVVFIHLFYPDGDRINSAGRFDVLIRAQLSSLFVRYGENSGDSMHAGPHFGTWCHYQIFF
jgi:hypothetical protein